jgi:SAM-dependent methyltransferase
VNATSAARAFDRIAARYDEVFTDSAIGRAQRNATWRELRREFHADDHVLEINCGTGEDALMLARSGVSVDAFDVSPRMIDVAEQRKGGQYGASVRFQALAIEDLKRLDGTYDGAFSNFGGLNCVQDLSTVARDLARLVRKNGRLILCLAGRFCAWESAWYGRRGDFRGASRRWRGAAEGKLSDDCNVPVFYPTQRQIVDAFSPQFRLLRRRGIGVVVPPSYASGSIFGSPGFVRFAESCDGALGRMPLLRAAADHALFVFERTAQ